MTSTGCLRMDIQAHSAIAVAGRIRLALEAAGLVTRLCGMVAYVPFQAFRIWRKMRTLAVLITAKHEAIVAKPTPDEVRHALDSLWELHGAVRRATGEARLWPLLRIACGPILGPIERDNDILRDFIDDVEMRLSPEFRASLQTALGELKPPTGVDWKSSLESMRR